MNCEEYLKIVRNGDRVALRDVPEIALSDFLQGLVDMTAARWRVVSYFGVPDSEGVSLWCVLAGAEGRLGMVRSWVEEILPSITSLCPQVHLFEREIAEQCRLKLEDHPWPVPVRYLPHHGTTVTTAGTGIHYSLAGSEVHEVAVGPVHAGIIEPGHFRFQCQGETVFHLEIALGYQHRGIEAALKQGPHRRTLVQMETVAGDSTVAHASAYAMVREALADAEPTTQAESIRAIALELERLANHCGDLGALAGDVGFLPTQSFCGRIRGDFLNMTAVLCGNRFGRSLVKPGGVTFDCSVAQCHELLRRLNAARQDLSGAVGLLWNSSSAMARFENAGMVKHEDALALGLVGPAARACGIEQDVRSEYPFGIYRASLIAPQTEKGGDVLARAAVRWKESQRSLEYLYDRLNSLPGGKVMLPCGEPEGEYIAVALVEGWRGEVCHVAITDADGRFARYKITDPSFHNWSGLAMALRSEQISDFPLCNKSFNLSYCGFDL